MEKYICIVSILFLSGCVTKQSTNQTVDSKPLEIINKKEFLQYSPTLGDSYKTKIDENCLTVEPANGPNNVFITLERSTNLVDWDPIAYKLGDADWQDLGVGIVVTDSLVYFCDILQGIDRIFFRLKLRDNDYPVYDFICSTDLRSAAKLYGYFLQGPYEITYPVAEQGPGGYFWHYVDGYLATANKPPYLNAGDNIQAISATVADLECKILEQIESWQDI